MNLDLEALSTVPELIIERARITPSYPAWKIWQNHAIKTVTWQEYYLSILSLAHGLRKVGIAADDRIALCIPNSLQWELLEKAGLFIGATIVGIDENAPLETKIHILKHANVNVLITNHLTSDLPSPFKCIITLEAISESNTTSSVIEYSALTREYVYDSILLPNPNSIATIVYTSGSTGTPKGIPYTQRQYLVTAQGILDPRIPSLAKGKTEDEVSICWLPLSNLFQRVINTVMIGWGGCSYLLDDPKRIMNTVLEVNPTLMIGVPRFYEKLQSSMEHHISTYHPLKRIWMHKCLAIGQKYGYYLENQKPLPLLLRLKHAYAERFALHHIRKKLFGENIHSLITGSAPTPLHVLTFFQSIGTPLLESYGLSENIIPIAMNRPGEKRSGSVGKPLLYNQVIIAEDNEVLVKGSGVFHGYLNDPHPEERVDQNGFLATGDYGYIDNDGYLFLTGRKSDLIKTSTGRRIFPRKIEAQLTSIPLIENAVVIGNNRKYLVAILALAPTYYTNFKESEAQCLQQLLTANVNSPPYEHVRGALVMPQGFSLEKGHLTPNMKLRRQVIEQQYEQYLNQLYKRIDANPSSNPLIEVS